MSSVEYLDSTSEEWETMWQQVASDLRNDGDQLCIHKGRSWEYMGSSGDHHHFRHDNHPATGNKEYIYIERKRMAAGWK